jgi:hypothetical protein
LEKERGFMNLQARGSMDPESPDYVAPTCLVIGCESLSALSSIAEDQFWLITTSYCSQCYEDLLSGKALELDLCRAFLERKPHLNSSDGAGPTI